MGFFSTPVSQNSQVEYHYPPVFQDSPMGPCLVGLVKANQPYQVINNPNSQDQNSNSLFVKDDFDPNLLWAKNKDGLLVKNSDGVLIYVPGRLEFPEDNSSDTSKDDSVFDTANSTASFTPLDPAIPPQMTNPCPGGLPKNPYSFGSSGDQQLQNTINDWLRDIFHPPKISDYQKDFEKFWFPLYQNLTPSAKAIEEARNKIATVGKISEIRNLLKGSSLDPYKLSEEQLLKFSDMKVAVDELFLLIDEHDLWNGYPCISAIGSVWDEEVLQSPQFVEKLINEFVSFSSKFPENPSKFYFEQKEKQILEGWDSFPERDKHLQAIADVLFDKNLKIKEESDWEIRFNQIKNNLAHDILKISRHIPKSYTDFEQSFKNGALGFLNGIVEGSKDPLLQPLYKPIKKFVTGELYPIEVSPEQASSLSYHGIKLATQLAMDGACFGIVTKTLKVLKPALSYAWNNRAALKAALTSDVLATDFLSKAGLISPSNGKLKINAEELKGIFKASGYCLHDAETALRKQASKGYSACIKEFNRRQGIRGYCIEKGLDKAMTDKIMAVDTLELQTHHIATNKNARWGFTEKFEKIVKKYGLDLNGEWNKIKMPHMGPHKKVYHQFVLDELLEIHNIARGNPEKFIELFDQRIKFKLEKDPLMVRGIGI